MFDFMRAKSSSIILIVVIFLGRLELCDLLIATFREILIFVKIKFGLLRCRFLTDFFATAIILMLE